MNWLIACITGLIITTILFLSSNWRQTNFRLLFLFDYLFINNGPWGICGQFVDGTGDDVIIVQKKDLRKEGTVNKKGQLYVPAVGLWMENWFQFGISIEPSTIVLKSHPGLSREYRDHLYSLIARMATREGKEWLNHTEKSAK